MEQKDLEKKYRKSIIVRERSDSGEMITSLCWEKDDKFCHRRRLKNLIEGGNKMKIIKGDLIRLAKEGKFDVIIHGCNCFCTMGAGIARAIKSEFPAAFEADCQTEKGDKTKLGDITRADVDISGHQLTIVNGYTQYNYSGSKPLVDYDAVSSVFRKVKELFHGRRIGYPKIGAGLAGGDWSVIERIINEELQGEDHALVEFVR